MYHKPLFAPPVLTCIEESAIVGLSLFVTARVNGGLDLNVGFCPSGIRSQQ